MKTRKNKSNYRLRYIRVMENLDKISKLEPQAKYMYCLMDTVIFHDFETALDVILEDFQNASNDNKAR